MELIVGKFSSEGVFTVPWLAWLSADDQASLLLVIPLLFLVNAFKKICCER
jgi:hypothetical protein